MPLSYENAGTYTGVLQDAYLDYKHLYKQVHLLGNDVDSGRKLLVAVPSSRILPGPDDFAQPLTGKSIHL